ncbi:hypothetical protein [Aliivibrio sifiae]|uniref:WD40 repeat protein n=1 Tax=Aliivibrio sifiae TaxID=566293 RepID=A0A2S7XJB5_9GAMM|nr:hypothetical protein [Aliivibrio sifiae]PQJ93491.1 hypothetical protein BTO23_05200 [Aliivibrio sifiae]GLR74420.1 hypothetical protein GCM10007855_12940 [Aliivibrio sifiae]
MKLMTLFILLFFMSPFVSNAKVELENKSLTYFENPFLIGDWYFFKPAHVENDYDVLHIALNSANEFTIEMIETSSNTVEEWKGTFEISQDSIRFEGREDESQVYHYQVSHNRLYLNGVEFFKVVPERMIGSWNSKLVSGEDIMVSNIESLNLKLRSDFVFLLEVISETGKRNQQVGYYYFEDDDLVLLYEDGEQESTFIINEGIFELKNEQFGMYALLQRE